MTLDGSGNLIIADQVNQRVRQVASGGGTITTIAGNGTAGFSGDGKSATAANLFNPFSVAGDSSGGIYIDDSFNNVVRKVSGGNINAFAGSAFLGSGYSGDGGRPVDAQLNQPFAVAIDSTGNVYISDTSNHRIRKVTSGGTISTYAGSNVGGNFFGDGRPAIAAPFATHRGLGVERAGNPYVRGAGKYPRRQRAALAG